MKPTIISKSPPLVTVVLMTYNQQNFVHEALQGAFNQTYTSLEIIISDDASVDSTWEALQEEVKLYQGPHKIYLRQNPKNLGINGHFNEVMKLVKGEFIVIMSGDDISLSHRVRDSIRFIQENDVSGVYSNAICIDQDGNETGLFVRETDPAVQLSSEMMLRNEGNGGCGFSMAWRRNINDVFGQIPLQPLGEDAFIPFRCALLGNFMYSPEPLIKYRQHAQNVSFWNEVKNAHNFKMHMAIAKKIAQHYLAMYRCWKFDLDKAYKLKIIPLEEYHNANSLLSDRILLQNKRLKYLDHSLFLLISQLIRERKVLANMKLKHVARRELASYLTYGYPNFFKLMMWIWRRLRQCGLIR